MPPSRRRRQLRWARGAAVEAAHALPRHAMHSRHVALRYLRNTPVTLLPLSSLFHSHTLRYHVILVYKMPHYSCCCYAPPWMPPCTLLPLPPFATPSRRCRHAPCAAFSRRHACLPLPPLPCHATGEAAVAGRAAAMPLRAASHYRQSHAHGVRGRRRHHDRASPRHASERCGVDAAKKCLHLPVPR